MKRILDFLSKFVVDMIFLIGSVVIPSVLVWFAKKGTEFLLDFSFYNFGNWVFVIFAIVFIIFSWLDNWKYLSDCQDSFLRLIWNLILTGIRTPFEILFDFIVRYLLKGIIFMGFIVISLRLTGPHKKREK